MTVSMVETRAAFIDQFGRSKRKLRISVTDRCNFKCVYCMPEHPEWMKKHQILSFEALFQFCQFMVQNGIEHIRITGGEPLMRQGVVHFVAELQKLKKIGLKQISMTSNGHYLKKYAQDLKRAGLDNINVSLDSLDAAQFFQLTQKQLQPVLEGIQAALDVGLPIKINSVLIQGKNEDQIIPLVQWAKDLAIPLRFIEFMPLDGDRHWNAEHVVSEQQILDTLATKFSINPLTDNTRSPARQYWVDGHQIGIISTITHAFCGECDRVRLTAQGEFYNCLFATQGLALKTEIEQLQTETKQNASLLQQKLESYIWNKKAGFHAIQTQQTHRKISMHMIGG